MPTARPQGRPLDPPDPKIRQLLDLVAARGEVSIASAVRVLGRSMWRTQLAVRVLEGAGLVLRERGAHGVTIRAVRA